MKFVLREYFASLKEDRELDSFILELSRSMNLIPLSLTQRGRQDGVDLCAIGEDEDKRRKVFLFVIKKGNFSRTTWNSGNINDIMPTLEEARIVYINTRIPERFKELKKKIVVCCNGYLEQTVDAYWSQYTRQYSSESLEYDFWGIDKLVELAETRQMNELILSPEFALQFRRSLSFIDLPDYNLGHFYKFLDILLPQNEQTKVTPRAAVKKLRLLGLCMEITNSWCEKSDNLKPAYIASERVLLNVWGWVIRNDLASDRNVLLEFYQLTITWKQFAHKYILKVWGYYAVPDGLASGVGEHNEYCILTYEQVGIVSCIGLYQLWDARFGLYSNDAIVTAKASESMLIAERIADSLALLIENNPSVYNPRFDEHCIEINMGMILLYQTGRFQIAANWLRSLIEYLGMNYQVMKFFPLFTTDVRKLSEPANDQSSILITILSEWCLVLKQPYLYKALKEIVEQNFPNVNLQLWLPDPNVDSKLFQQDASNDFGSTLINIKLPDNIKEYEMWIAEERVNFDTESDSSVFKYGVDFLLPIANRHFRTYPFPNTWRKLMSSCF